MSVKQSKKTTNKGPAATVISQNPIGVILPEPLLEFSHSTEPRPTVIFRSEQLGVGHQELGEQLMAEFFLALLAHPEPPAAMLFYHTAIKLTLESSPVREAIRQLAAKGSEVLICRTSMQNLAPGQQPAVGRVASLAELTDRMRQAHLLLWP